MYEYVRKALSTHSSTATLSVVLIGPALQLLYHSKSLHKVSMFFFFKSFIYLLIFSLANLASLSSRDPKLGH